MSATFMLVVEPGESGSDLWVFEAESLEELSDELQRLATASGSMTELVLDLRPDGRPPFAVPEALSAAVRAFEGMEELTVRCLLASDKALSVAKRCLPGDQRLRASGRVGEIEVDVICGNIVRVDADAIVNASNTRLALGGGVSGAIKAASRDPAGLQNAMFRLAPITSDEAVVTASYGVPGVNWLIHVPTAAGKAEGVRASLRALFQVCEERSFGRIALPALGAGTGGLAIEACAQITLEEIEAASADGRTHPRSIAIVLYTGESYERFAEALRQFGTQRD